MRRASALAVDREGFVFITELGSPPGHESWVHGRVEEPFPARISVFDLQGRLQARFAYGAHPCDPGSLVAPHGLAFDSQGGLYVAEVTRTSLAGGTAGLDPATLEQRHCHAVQKFAPA
jgi:hypothetical protein